MTKTKAEVAAEPKEAKRHLLYAPEGEAATDQFEAWIVGTTPLIVHAWSHKAKLEMLGKQLKQTKGGRDARNPEQDFVSSLYSMSNGEPLAAGDPLLPNSFGFPITGLKKAVVSSGHKSKGVPRTEVQASLWLNGEFVRVGAALAGAICDMPLARLFAEAPEMREDMVRVGSGLNKTATLAYRAQFTNWAIRISGELNTNVVTAEQLLFLIRESGREVGIGEWRNEKGGVFGAYHLATVKEAQAWERWAKGEGPIPQRVDTNTPAMIAAE